MKPMAIITAAVVQEKELMLGRDLRGWTVSRDPIVVAH